MGGGWPPVARIACCGSGMRQRGRNCSRSIVRRRGFTQSPGALMAPDWLPAAARFGSGMPPECAERTWRTSGAKAIPRVAMSVPARFESCPAPLSQRARIDRLDYDRWQRVVCVGPDRSKPQHRRRLLRRRRQRGGDRRERAIHWAGLSEGVVVERPRFRAVRPTTSVIPGPYA